jgi:hypothetical protein
MEKTQIGSNPQGAENVSGEPVGSASEATPKLNVSFSA